MVIPIDLSLSLYLGEILLSHCASQHGGIEKQQGARCILFCKL